MESLKKGKIPLWTRLFPAYLQGMESAPERHAARKSSLFPAYLQGMES